MIIQSTVNVNRRKGGFENELAQWSIITERVCDIFLDFSGNIETEWSFKDLSFASKVDGVVFDFGLYISH